MSNLTKWIIDLEVKKMDKGKLRGRWKAGHYGTLPWRLAKQYFDWRFENNGRD